jgi:hypothetical protein
MTTSMSNPREFYEKLLSTVNITAEAALKEKIASCEEELKKFQSSYSNLERLLT